MRFLPVGVPYHSPYLHDCTSAAMSTDVDSTLASFFSRGKLLIPVFNTETGRDLRTASSAHGDAELLKELYDQIFTSPIHWAQATKFNGDATHVVDFGTGGQSGIGSLTARESEGRGTRVLVAASGTNGRGVEEVYSAQKLKVESRWMDRFGPKLVKTAHDGKIHLNTAMSRLLSKPPLMVAGMTPCTVGAGFNAAVANAGASPSPPPRTSMPCSMKLTDICYVLRRTITGYHIELAGGGHYTPKALRGKVDDIISRFETPGIGLTLNALYINQRQFTFQLPLWVQMKGEGLPVEGLCVAAGIPSTENATNILDQLRGAGVKHVSFKPGSVEGIRQVVNIASANPDFPIILQWTGGRAGGHHSCEDFHQPVLSTYASIRQYPNIILVGGSGFGSPGDDVWPYLNGSWSEAYGVERMPFDGFLYASRVMVAKEAHTSLSVKQLIVDAPGVGDDKWEGTYDKETGGIITVRSELGEPIHKVATRGVKLWKEFDNTVFALPREKRGAWLAERKDEVIRKLNKDFQKPWFAAKSDGTVCDLGEMTYAEVASRMVRLMYVAHEKRWIDPTLKSLTGDWLRRTEDRLSSVNDYTPKPSALQSYSSLDSPQEFLATFFEQHYPQAKTQIIASEDIAYFLAICQRPGQKPTPFIAVLDNNFEVWFKKDSLWFAEDVEAVCDQDPQRVCILQGPVAVKHCTKVDEPIADMFGAIKDNLIQNVLQEFYRGDEALVPTVEYLAQTPASASASASGAAASTSSSLTKHFDIKHTTRAGESAGTTVHVYEISGNLPPTGEWLEHLSGPKLDWLRAFLLSVNVSQGKTGLVENSAKKLFKPRKGQRVELTVGDEDGRPRKVAVFGAIRN